MEELKKKMSKLEEDQDVKVCLISLTWVDEIKCSSSPLEDSAPEEHHQQLSGDQARLEQCEECRGRYWEHDEVVQ